MRHREFCTERISRAEAEKHIEWIKQTKRDIERDEAAPMNMEHDTWLHSDYDVDDMNWRWELEDKTEQNRRENVIPKILKKLGHPSTQKRCEQMDALLKRRQHERLMKHRKIHKN